MNSGDNSEQMPPEASIEAEEIGNTPRNLAEKVVIKEEPPVQNRLNEPTELNGVAEAAPPKENGGVRTAMKTKTGKKVGEGIKTSDQGPSLNTATKARSKADGAKKPSLRTSASKSQTLKASLSEEQIENLTKGFFGANVKPWLEAQDLHLKREEAQQAFSSTIEALCKDKELKEHLKSFENNLLAPNPLALILRRCVERNYLLGTKDLKKFEKELKRFNFDLSTTHLTLKGFMIFSASLMTAPILELLKCAEWQGLPREFKFMEILLELVAQGMLSPDENPANLYSALPPELKKECGKFDGDIGSLFALRNLLEKDSVKKHLNGTRLAGQSPEDRFLSLLLNLVEKEGLNPDTDYRLVYGALPLKRKGDLTDCPIEILYLTQLRKALDHDSIKRQFKEWNKLSLSPKERFVELVLALRGEKLVSPEMTENQIFSALPPKIRSEMQFVQMPFADITNFRSFFRGQSIQARLHMLLGAEKTPWQRFQGLNAFLYDPSNEATRGNLKGTLPADYYELHNWLPPELRAVTSPNPDEDPVEEVVPGKSSEFREDKKEPYPHKTVAANDQERKAETNSGSTNKNTTEPTQRPLGLEPRFSDHSVRQKTSLYLRAHSPNQSYKPATKPSEVMPQGFKGTEAPELPPLVDPDFKEENRLLESKAFGEDDRGEYRSGSTWNDDNEQDSLNPSVDPSIDLGEIVLKSGGQNEEAIQLGYDEPRLSAYSEVPLEDDPKVSKTSSKDVDDNGWEAVHYNSNVRGWNTEDSGLEDKKNHSPSVAPKSMPVEAIEVKQEYKPAEPAPVVVQETPEPGKGASINEHLEYTASANITPEERLFEFAVFLSKNDMLVATSSFNELYEKLPKDIKPGFKPVDFDLGKFLEFREDIGRHFVKEHLRATKEKGLEGEDRFAEFIIFLRKNGLMPSLPDSAEVYKLLPIVLKREFGNVLSSCELNVELRKNLEVEAVKEHLTALECSDASPEDRLVELGIFLQRNELLAGIDNLRELHAQLPFDMRRNFKRCDAKIKGISIIRAVLEKEMIREHLRSTKEAGANDEERFVELVIFLKRNELVSPSTSPNDIYTALPFPVKKELRRCDFPSDAVIQVRDSLDKPPVQQQVELLKKMWFSNQEKFMELAVFMKQNGYMPANADANLLYCGLPANLKKELSIIDMPLDAVVQLRKNLEKEFVKAHIKSSEGDNLSPEERFVELIVFLYRNELMPDIPNLDDVYTALPAELRLEFSRTEIPLEQIMLFRDILDKESVRQHWNRSRSAGGSGEDRFADLVVFLKKEGLLLFEDNLGYFYTALPVEFKRELSNFIFKVETISRLKSAIKAAEVSAAY